MAAQDGAGGSVAAARNTQVAGAQQSQFAGSSSSNVAAARSSDTRIASSVNASSASASDQKNVQAGSFSAEQKNVQNQKDVVTFKSKTASMSSSFNSTKGIGRFIPALFTKI